jgi:hypothetical protein
MGFSEPKPLSVLTKNPLLPSLAYFRIAKLLRSTTYTLFSPSSATEFSMLNVAVPGAAPSTHDCTGAGLEIPAIVVTSPVVESTTRNVLQAWSAT